MADQLRPDPVAKDNASETASDPLLSQSDLTAIPVRLGADQTLGIGPKFSLILADDALVALDKAHVKPTRSCCFPTPVPSPTTRSIPYYNILWASLSDDSRALTVDYAEEAPKLRLRPATLTFPFPSPLSAAERATTSAWIETLLARSYGRATRAKRAYVLVNPHAGPGGADKIWEKQVEPLFRAARMPLTVVRTERPGEAVGLAERLDADAFDIVAALSGDGLPHEVFNGLARRPDARRALSRLAVCHIPCGSGNAMSCNLYGTHRPSLATLAVIKGVPTPLDLVSVTQGDTRTLSFLSQALGIVADLDISTEHMRWMGPHRFTLGFLMLVMKKKVYPCDIAVKVEIECKHDVKEHYRDRVLRRGGEYSEARAQISSTPTKENTDANGLGLHAGQTEAPTPGGADHDDSQSLPPLKYGTVKDDLPEGWELIPHEKLGNFYCGNMAYMTPDANFFAAALANDGLMDLIVINGDVGATRAIQMQLSLESGHFFDNPLVSYRKVSAYRIIPRHPDERGYVSIDGERAPFEPFQAEVHRGLGLTLSKRGCFEAPGPRNWDRATASERLAA